MDHSCSVFNMTRRRKFWCALVERDVEVEFEEHGLPGFRWQYAVKRCSAFDPCSDVQCRRRCLDVAFRRQWPPAMPLSI